MMKETVFTFLISMVPIIELRGAIPYGVANDVPIWCAYLASVVGNMIPVPFIILFVRKLFKWMKEKSKWLGNIARRFEEKAEKKKSKVLKYEFWGLVLLVAIPLPGTGAWTGSMVAAMVDMQLKRALPAICTGVIIAGIVVTFMTCGVTALV